ncbi:MAG: START domain-containing protein, partial [Myxococcota bacterium]|nr:START domain-containing protein [Myxococcota bacterium]
GVEVGRKTMPDSPLFAFRGEADLDVHIGVLAEVLWRDGLGVEWVDLMILSERVELLDDTNKIVHQGYGLPWPISDRDYVMLESATFDETTKTFTLQFKSTEHASMPEQEDFIRAQAYRTFWHLQANDTPGSTHVEVEVYTDPKGLLPSWLINLIQKDWPSTTITNLDARAQKGDIPSHPMAADW